ncbi:MAG: sulfatase-like hydrolase/transferase [Planctomycetota bacterium]
MQLVLALLAAIAPAASAQGDESQLPNTSPPNILVLFADDLRADMVGAFGAAKGNAHTPNLDQLAQRGTKLTRIYCQGSRHGAVCAPSRAMLMSGRRLTRTTDDLQGISLLPEWLREAGYATFATGKWHNGKASLRRAFPDASSVFLGGMCDHFQVPLCDVEGGEVVRSRRPAGHSTEHFAEATIAFLRQHRARDREKPFFAYVPFTAPHDPRDPPQRWLDRLADMPKPQLPANFRGQHGLNLGKMTMTVRDENLLGWPRDPAEVRQQLVEYRALVAHLDEQIGRILAALDELGLRDNTLVVFTADHGLALGSHGLLGKQSLYEHSMRAPCIVAGPGVPAGAERDGLCYLLDLTTTIARWAGLPHPSGVDGVDLRPMILAGEAGRAELFLLYAGSQRAIVRSRYKLIRLPQIDRTLAFDLAQDPGESRPLAAGVAGVDAEIARGLGAALRRMQADGGDAAAWLADPQLKPVDLDLTGKRWPPDRWQPQWIRQRYWPKK